MQIVVLKTGIGISHRAKQDIEDIWIYSFKKWGEKQADRYFDKLSISINETLLENPKIGITCNDIRVGYRQYQVNKHIIFYKLTSNTIYIIRLFYKNMEFKKHFLIQK